MTRADVIAKAEEALRLARCSPEAEVTGTDTQAFVRVSWGDLDNPCVREFPANSKLHAIMIRRAINGDA